MRSPVFGGKPVYTWIHAVELKPASSTASRASYRQLFMPVYSESNRVTQPPHSEIVCVNVAFKMCNIQCVSHISLDQGVAEDQIHCVQLSIPRC